VRICVRGHSMLPGQCPFYTMTSDDTMPMRESAQDLSPQSRLSS
jgi:hypothetical protein